MVASDQVVIHKIWRSELERLILFFLLCVAAVILSIQFPASVIRGELITVGNTRIILLLPLYALLPAVSLGDLIARIYNVRYVLNRRGLEAREGIISLNQYITAIRFEDIRLIEVDQNLVGRFLNYGNVRIGTAATGEAEIVMHGVEAPREIQSLVQAERDRRQQVQDLAHNTESEVQVA